MAARKHNLTEVSTHQAAMEGIEVAAVYEPLFRFAGAVERCAYNALFFRQLHLFDNVGLQYEYGVVGGYPERSHDKALGTGKCGARHKLQRLSRRLSYDGEPVCTGQTIHCKTFSHFCVLGVMT